MLVFLVHHFVHHFINTSFGAQALKPLMAFFMSCPVAGSQNGSFAVPVFRLYHLEASLSHPLILPEPLPSPWMEVGLRRAAGFRTETCANVSSSFLLIAFVLKEGIPELTVSEIFPPIPSVPLPFSEAVTIIPRSQIEEPRGIDSAEAALPPPHRAPAAGSITFLQHHLKPPSSTINHV